MLVFRLLILFLPNKKATQGVWVASDFFKSLWVAKTSGFMANCYLLSADRLKDLMRLKHKS
jgi:hypothetical protein